MGQEQSTEHNLLEWSSLQQHQTAALPFPLCHVFVSLHALSGHQKDSFGRSIQRERAATWQAGLRPPSTELGREGAAHAQLHLG